MCIVAFQAQYGVEVVLPTNEDNYKYMTNICYDTWTHIYIYDMPREPMNKYLHEEK